MSEANRPGTMVYFDLLDDLEEYTDAEVGQIFRAILNYGKSGITPSFEDRGMRTLWRSLQGKMDRDCATYQERVSQRQKQRKYAAYCKKEKSAGRDPEEYGDWLDAIDGNES